MSKKKPEPEEYARFGELFKGLLRVPKTELDKRMRRYESDKARKKRALPKD